MLQPLPDEFIARGDADPGETQEWRDALGGLVRHGGAERALFVLRQLQEHAQELGLVTLEAPHSAYQNTIPLAQQGPYPGDLALEQRITAIMRWNALAMVVRANQAYGELGGHIASYASAAEIFEAGFNHFFRAPDAQHGGDLVFFQPHSAPGVYARAFLEGDLSEEQLAHYRQEVGGARPVLVSASVADARLLAVPDRLDGTRARSPRSTRRASCAISSTAASATRRRSPCMGRVRRRRDGRAGIDRRADARRARGPRQPHVRHQLQPAAPRRPGARQRPDHPGAGGAVHRRRAGT